MSIANDQQRHQDDYGSGDSVDIYFKNAIDRNEIMSDIVIRTIREFQRERSTGSTSARIGTLVDVGCGSGKQTQAFSKHFNHTIGIDPSEAQVTMANEMIQQSDIEFRVGSGEKIPTQDGIADAISGVFVAHFLEMDKFVEECKRVLKPGGIAVLSGYIFSKVSPVSEPHKLDEEKETAATELWEKCRMAFLRHAQDISHLEQHNLESCAKLYNEVTGINKRRQETYFEIEMSLKRLTEYLYSVPFYGTIAIENPWKIFCRDLKKLWKQEDNEDENVIARFTCKVYLLILINE